MAAGSAAVACGNRYPMARTRTTRCTSRPAIPDPSPGNTAGFGGPTFRTPTSRDDAVSALREAYERSATQRVEIACGGGVGRTGTALAAIAVLAGVPSTEAAAWVRRRYNKRAVETPWQRRWVLGIDGAH